MGHVSKTMLLLGMILLARLNIVSLVHNFKALASAIPEISMGHPKLKTYHVT